ncbi:lipocalin family protein [Aestuariicella hydrocarbonica]|uniref:Lipocalin family protein n=1 Tax=Pseudomaricurvus hydrocarbonicus TaxID=1470433 RepID=A0A9E5MI06_9GAMM|nr:lipocalin family protein [Aestuariicella hydrocarbonica]NHO66666.1 lipocalin family protein [Aestuariicella hydrocarbonica]
MIEKIAQTNVNLEDQLSYKDLLPQGMPYLENNGFMIMGETDEGDEVSFVSCIFRVGGGKEGPWQVDDEFKGQTTFMVTPKDHHGKGMQDTKFVGNRSWATDDWSRATIEKTDDAVIWTLGNRKHICRPPYWEIKGEHMGVEFDLLLTGIGDAAYHKGPYPDLAKNNIAGFEHPLCAEGTLKYEGKTYTLRKDKSFGCQEKFTQPAFDLAQVLRGETYYWNWWASDRVRIFIYSYPQMNKSYSHVTVDGEDISFMENGQSDITMEELEYWVDPQTRLRVPVKWHFSMKHPNGNIEMDIEASSRTYYSYLTKSGATMHYGLHSHSEGEMKLADGRTIPLTDMRTYVEHGWTAIPLIADAC